MSCLVYCLQDGELVTLPYATVAHGRTALTDATPFIQWLSSVRTWLTPYSQRDGGWQCICRTVCIANGRHCGLGCCQHWLLTSTVDLGYIWQNSQYLLLNTSFGWRHKIKYDTLSQQQGSCFGVKCVFWRCIVFVCVIFQVTQTHTYTHVTALYPWLPRWAGTRKV